ncbi:MAG: energy-coupling factor transporter ATPase [Lachnospiraceae bacterium]|nr:energy-coupling factor transporter ATPase [Lachnospiraceae bacterium]
MIKARKLAYEYIRRDEEGNVEGIIRALDGVDLDVKRGDFVAILGHNGSGKSTIAKEINAILEPTEGTLYVDGIDVSNGEKVWEVRQTAGLVFQNPDNQIVASVVEEDVAFGPENLGVPTDEIHKRVDYALERVEMTSYRKSSPNALSGGQKQRVAIAGILAMKPKCIVLDEPTAMLDPGGRKEVIRTLHELNKNEGITILLITHYMTEVKDADKVIVMDDGKIVMQGTPKQVFSRVDELKAHHLDVPQVTELAYELKKGGINLPDGILTNKEFVDALLGQR